MDPLSALSLASAVIQLIEFSSKVIARASDSCASTDGKVNEATFLENAVSNLDELIAGLETTTFSSLKGRGRKTSDLRLARLAEESHAIAIDLREILKDIQGMHQTSVTEFSTLVEHSEMANPKRKLGEIRREVDAALLASLQ
jgi:hypothetical protein